MILRSYACFRIIQEKLLRGSSIWSVTGAAVMARVGFSSLNVNQMAGNKGMIAVCLRSRQQERSRNGPLDLVETHNNQQLQRQQQAVPLSRRKCGFFSRAPSADPIPAYYPVATPCFELDMTVSTAALISLGGREGGREAVRGGR